MKISDFVRETLREIVQGVSDAQEPVGKIGGTVNPKGCNYLLPGAGTIQHGVTSQIGQDVEFDIAVSVNESKEHNGADGVPNLGIAGEPVAKEKAVTRVKFRIPLIFPKGECSEDMDTSLDELMHAKARLDRAIKKRLVQT